jgi:uncharacterized protein (TIGR00730 family)
MPHVQSVAVFCGSQAGNAPVFRAAAEELGRGLADSAMRLIYGGGRVGLMGAMADASLAAGGTVVGVIPEFLTRQEVAHEGVAELIVTESMHSRKRRMFDLSDAFVSFAGGLGTLDETFEILTWRQLKLHGKPVLICDVAGSSRALLANIEATIETGFAKAEIRELFEVLDGVPATLERLRHLATAIGSTSAVL